MWYKSFKTKVYEIIEKGQPDDKASAFFDHILVFMIALNVLAITLETFEIVRTDFSLLLRIVEIFSIFIFTIEYLLRIWTANLKYKTGNVFISILLFVISPMAIIDLLAILPFYIPFIIPLDLRFLRILRLMRLLRLFKVKRYSKSLDIITKVLREKREELVVSIFVMFMLLLTASIMMYYVENNLQPDKFRNVFDSFWWAVATLTTVGYGDVYPLSGWGKLISGVIALLGIGMVALPTGIISSGFIEEISKKKTNKKACSCPHCGKPIL